MVNAFLTWKVFKMAPEYIIQVLVLINVDKCRLESLFPCISDTCLWKQIIL